MTSILASKASLKCIFAGEQQPATKRTRRHSLPAVTQELWRNSFLALVVKANPIAAGLSSHKDHNAPFKTPPSSPLDLTKLYDHTKLDLPYAELIDVCKKLMDKMKVTPRERQNIEEKTRNQAHNILWYLYRRGRITGSMAHKVWQGDINNPAKSTWQVICKGQSKESQRQLSLNKDIQRGRDNEEVARKEYISTKSQKHTNLVVSLSGLVLHPELPFIASSPDGRVSCSCCPQFGALEIKCPREENLTKCLDDNGDLLKTHDYWFQTHMHMLVTGASYCDLYLWLDTSTSADNTLKPLIVQVNRDVEFLETLEKKVMKYFLYVILPEMVAHWFTRASSEQRLPLQALASNPTVPNICFCQTPRRDPVVICAGTNCTFTEFHARCVDLAQRPAKKWHCQECLPSAPKRNRRRAVSLNNEENVQ